MTIETVDLTGTWSMRDAAPGSGEDDGLAVAPVDGSWRTVDVPGDVHSALLRDGTIPDPFGGDDVEQCQWVEYREWWFRRDIGPLTPGGPEVRDVLVFDGLDTCATIYLDGAPIAEHANMFRPLEVEVTGRLAGPRQHQLAVRFDPVRDHRADIRVPDQWGHYHADERVRVRKTQAQFSWDHAPRLVNVGSWLPIRLERRRAAHLVRPHVRILRADACAAVVSVDATVEKWCGAAATVTVRMTGHGYDTSLTGLVEDGSVSVTHTVHRPTLWWPAGHGEAALYDLVVTLNVDGVVVDRSVHRIGLRTIELDRSPSTDEPGCERFTFRVNGVPVFAKGANWVPADILNGRITTDRYRALLDMLVAAHGNMIRVWGGGQYERDCFYDTCDELGILVWQDFMLACGRYPDDDPEFVTEVELEARHQVARLRNHPCLVLWCGNNEIETLEDRHAGQVPGTRYPGHRLTHEVIAGVVAELDPDTPWWPSSPFGGDDHNSETVGDRHNWTTWHGVAAQRRSAGPDGPPEWGLRPADISFHHLERDRARFLSEFGVHALPCAATLRRYLTEDALSFGSPMLRLRDRNGSTGRLDTLMRAHTGLPSTFEEYVTFSMWCQAEGLRRGIEAARSRKFDCSGTLFWQWNDAWPGISWSVLDVLGHPKAGYYAAKRSYAPVLVTATERGGTVRIHLVNDTLDRVQDTVTWRLLGVDGTPVESGESTVEVAPNSVHLVTVLPVPPEPVRHGVVLWLGTTGGSAADNRFLFVDIRDLHRDGVPVDTRWAPDGPDLVGTLRASATALFVHIGHHERSLILDDNWFDLAPGQVRTVRLPGCADLDPAEVEVSWL